MRGKYLYLVVIERASDGSYSAYLPDVPGCVSCGDTVDEAKALIHEALGFHFKGIRRAALPLPMPTSVAEYIGAGSG
jgi:predicted RNase H-like HicB family nuclease